MANLNSIYSGAVDVNKGGGGGRWMTGLALAQQMLSGQQQSYHAPSWVRRADLEHSTALGERSLDAAHLRTMQLEKTRHQQIMQRTRHAGRMLTQLRDQGIQVGGLRIDADGAIHHTGIEYTTPRVSTSSKKTAPSSTATATPPAPRVATGPQMLGMPGMPARTAPKNVAPAAGATSASRKKPLAHSTIKRKIKTDGKGVNYTEAQVANIMLAKTKPSGGKGRGKKK